MSWTSPQDVRARVRRRFDDQSLLRAYAARAPFPVIEVPLRGPRPADIGERLDEVRAWMEALESGAAGGRRYRLEHATLGGRSVGRNEVPSRAYVESYAQAWAILGVGAEVARLDAALAVTANEPTVAGWVAANPRRAIDLDDAWPEVLAAYRWLVAHRGSGRYLREISAPGVDTKVVERHRSMLAALLGVSGSSPGFTAGLGLATKPQLIRLRPCPSLGLLPGAHELAVRHDELGGVDVRPDAAVVVENETTYLSLPVPSGGVVLWGKGFDVDQAGRLPWLRGTTVHYWGDLDTHGFAILDRLRAWLPQTSSFLMDRATLMAHRDRWGREERPTSARLQRLQRDESDLFTDLVEDRLGDRVRLEQERIDWVYAVGRLPYT